MLFSKPADSAASGLKPFVLRTRDGFLVGLAMDPEKGSPCVRCVQGWLEKRGMGSQPGKIEELNIRRDVLAELLASNSAHVIYEVHHDGTVNRLKSTVFPLPGCPCSKGKFAPPQDSDPTNNLTFSPITSIKCVRYVTPQGHLWLTSASGQHALGKERISVYGAGSSKAASRRAAIDNWLKQAAVADLRERQNNEAIAVEVLQTGNGDFLSLQSKKEAWTALGAGSNYEEATLEALYTLTRQKTLQGYANTAKNPMLVVGANNWIRQRVPFFLLQEYDLHLLFYPNASPCWVVGLAAFSRTKADAKPLFTFSSDADINVALEGLIAKLLEWARPEGADGMEEAQGSKASPDSAYSEKGFKLNLWWTHWIYRCAKITLKDILHLESYPRSVDYWRDYLRDGQANVTLVPLNHADLPTDLRVVVRLVQLKELAAVERKVVGIGTLSPFQDAVL
ncbi:hypothetical protein K2X33_16720 [bacterium]|nr:hypothetical protein [bacterium]